MNTTLFNEAEALRREEEMFSFLLDHTPDQVYFKDLKGCFLRASKAVATLLGASDPKELIGKTLITHQTGPKGRKVHRLLIEEGANIAKEL